MDPNDPSPLQHDHLPPPPLPTVYAGPSSATQFRQQQAFQGQGAAPQPPQMPQPPQLPLPHQMQPAPMLQQDAWSSRLQRLQQLAMRYEIRPDWVAKLRQLEAFRLVMVLDDSGSMNTHCAPGPGAPPRGPYAPPTTRWTELCSSVSAVVELAAALNDEGVDCYFLNRPPVLRATAASQVQAAFAYAPPNGYTPLARVTQGVLDTYRGSLGERRLLLVIATDGQPTDDVGNVNIPAFLRLLRSKGPNVYVQIMACTDDDDSVAWLNEADRDIPLVDVTDDFFSERSEVLKAQGANFHFTPGDYLVKALLGPIDPYFDGLDEPKGGSGSCAVA